MIAALFLALLALSFLLGSIPWGLIVSKAFFKTDIRDQGSGNIGATNAVRSMGAAGGAAVFLLDAGKGALAGALACFVFAPLLAGEHALGMVELFKLITGDAAAAEAAVRAGQVSMLCASVAFFGCTAGHSFSPWLGFHGGKGISVAFGCEFFALTPVGALIELALFAVLTLATRIVSVGSIAAAVLCPFLALWICWGCWPAIALITAAALLVIWAHRGNIKRLCAGEEPRFGSKGARPDKADAAHEEG